jgi:hypothetical protein
MAVLSRKISPFHNPSSRNITHRRELLAAGDSNVALWNDN